jgi:hypothetical protein
MIEKELQKAGNPSPKKWNENFISLNRKRYRYLGYQQTYQIFCVTDIMFCDGEVK